MKKKRISRPFKVFKIDLAFYIFNEIWVCKSRNVFKLSIVEKFEKHVNKKFAGRVLEKWF